MAVSDEMKEKVSSRISEVSVSGVELVSRPTSTASKSPRIKKIPSETWKEPWEVQASKQLDEFKKKTEDSIESQLNTFKAGLENKLSDKVNRDIKDLQTKIIELLAVFVALFTFVSLDFSLLKNSINLGVSVSLILIAGGLLVAFVLLTHLVLSSEDENKKDIKWWWILTLALVGTGIAYLGISLKIGQISQEIDTSNINLEVSNKFNK